MSNDLPATNRQLNLVFFSTTFPFCLIITSNCHRSSNDRNTELVTPSTKLLAGVRCILYCHVRAGNKYISVARCFFFKYQFRLVINCFYNLH